jgi:hypothetical protein
VVVVVVVGEGMWRWLGSSPRSTASLAMHAATITSAHIQEKKIDEHDDDH